MKPGTEHQGILQIKTDTGQIVLIRIAALCRVHTGNSCRFKKADKPLAQQCLPCELAPFQPFPEGQIDFGIEGQQGVGGR